MYQYVRTFPYDRENGWSNELNGVCHDDENWYFTQNGRLWKFPIGHNLNTSCKREDRANGIFMVNPFDTLRSIYPKRGKNSILCCVHLGDIDHFTQNGVGYIFVPVIAEYVSPMGSSKKYSSISVFKACDLSFVSAQVIRREDGKVFSTLGWLAINQKNGLLYTSDNEANSGNGDSKSKIHVYKIGDPSKANPLTLHSTAILADENGNTLKRGAMQGGCFDGDYHLYIMNGWWTQKASHNYSKDGKGGISVFKTSKNPAEGQTEMLYRLTRSYQTGGFQYQFDKTGDEPQGLTYWDLDKDRRAPGIDGQLHAIMLSNTGTGDDDFYFKHYRRNFNAGFYRVTIKTGTMDGAGTDAGIFVTFHGARGVSNECELDSPGDDFERGSTGYYLVETVNNVGALDHIVIRSDNAGKYAEYYLESVTVQDMESGYYYDFTANLWLNKSRCSCTLTPTRKHRPRTGIKGRS